MQKRNVFDIISKFILIINLIKHTFCIIIIKRSKKNIYIYIIFINIFIIYDKKIIYLCIRDINYNEL